LVLVGQLRLVDQPVLKVQILYLAQSLLLVVEQARMPLIVLEAVQQVVQEVLARFKLVVLVRQDKAMRVAMLWVVEVMDTLVAVEAALVLRV
jgi:hypothetical protein